MLILILVCACWSTHYVPCAVFVCCCCQKISPSDRQQPARPPPPVQSTEIGEAVARYNFSADTNVELSLRKARLGQYHRIPWHSFQRVNIEDIMNSAKYQMKTWLFLPEGEVNGFYACWQLVSSIKEDSPDAENQRLYSHFKCPACIMECLRSLYKCIQPFKTL